MPGSKSNLVSLHEGVTNDTSYLREKKISDEKGSVEKRTMTLIEKNGYHDSVYINAAKIFQGIHTKKLKDRILVRYGDDSVSPMLTVKNQSFLRISYELAFNALKYQDLLEEVLLDSCVYPCHSIPEELTSLLVVMLYDLQERKFQAREIFDEEEPVAEVRKIEHYLYSFKTKLAAALARCRIKHDALSIEYTLPEAIQKQVQRASALPLCVWINTFKISLQDVFGDLKKKGFTRVESVSDFNRYTYCMDQHCNDVLLFPSFLKEELLNLDLFADCKLLLQDKSRSLAVHSARALLNVGDDVIVAQAGSHLTIAHMSALTIHSTTRIFVCGVKSSGKAAELKNLFGQMGCKNIQLIDEDFTEIEPTDSRLQNAKVVLLLPECSGLGVGNPVDFIVNEQGDAGLLRDVFQGSVSQDKLNALAERQLRDLMHAMKFTKVQAIVYCTCSVYPEENELVVKKALESRVEGNKLQPYRLIPPVFSACSNPEASTETFFKMEPSETSSGCFLAVLEREKGSSDNVSAKDILARAASKGLLGDLLVEESKEEEKKQPKVTQCSSDITAGGTKPKTAEHRQAVPNTKAGVPLPKAVSNVQQKTVNLSKSLPWLKKPHKLVPTSAVPRVWKRRAGPGSAGRARGGQAQVERRRLALKTVDIILPPVTPTYVSQQGNQPRTSAQPCCAGAKGWGGRGPPQPPGGRTLAPPLTTVVEHPRPWL
ncbi:PREDICTED: putative methyltransferase NSUN7 isoform X1 [Calidris pugnax]|uniref:putative methyltransferase NSUN7 isoform X1 n=1 Tax=Calidris pugnax TaxID=198806 RepID=UPI00071C7664|nr:PREDICTED: putative methyltransferase NSUN7 isoform X1 [Calidris pugnax]